MRQDFVWKAKFGLGAQRQKRKDASNAGTFSPELRCRQIVAQWNEGWITNQLSRNNLNFELKISFQKKSRWFPPISEIWGLIFGGAGNSKGPLLLFLFSVLLWGYPMYIIRVSNTHTALVKSLWIPNFFLVYSDHLVRSTEISLLFYLLECNDVDQLGSC